MRGDPDSIFGDAKAGVIGGPLAFKGLVSWSCFMGISCLCAFAHWISVSRTAIYNFIEIQKTLCVSLIY